VKKGPSKQDFAKQKMEENYKPKPKQVKGKKKKAVQKQKVSEKVEIEKVIIEEKIQAEINPKKSGLGRFWWWLTNG
jgi:hypothetical protein